MQTQLSLAESGLRARIRIHEGEGEILTNRETLNQSLELDQHITPLYYFQIDSLLLKGDYQEY